MLLRTGLGIKLLNGLAEASTNGLTTYAYRYRVRSFRTRQGLDQWKVPYCYWAGRRPAGDTPYEVLKEGWTPE